MKLTPIGRKTARIILYTSVIGTLAAILLYAMDLFGSSGHVPGAGQGIIWDESETRAGEVNVLRDGAAGDGVTDDTLALQATIDRAAAQGKTVYVPKGVYKVSSKQMRDSGSKDWWALKLPSDADIRFQKGAVIKLAGNAPKWTRVLVIANVSNVKLTGILEIDGSSSTVKDGNEHMAGLFIFSASNVSIETVNAHDTYGDNIFVGGTEQEPSVNIAMKNAIGYTAGRKNFVIHFVDRLHVERAVLDNTRGGAPDFKGANSLDLEPDDFAGTRSFSQRIDYIATFGTGNDFTAGTSEALARKWTLDIGTFNIHATGRTASQANVPSIILYALTLRIDSLTVQSEDDRASAGVQMLYGGSLNVNTAVFEGGSGPAMDISANEKGKPKVQINHLKVNRPEGGGLKIWGADVTVNQYEALRLKGRALDIYSSAKQTVAIKSFTSVDSGGEQLIYVAQLKNNEIVLDIDKLNVSDNRAKKVQKIMEFASKEAMARARIGVLINPNRLPERVVN